MYATLFVGMLDPVTRVLHYVNAGHNPQYRPARDGRTRAHGVDGPAGRPARGARLQRSVASQLAPGDVLFFYTDGCVEAENEAGEMFGPERLEALLTGRPAESGDDLLAHVERAIVQFRAGREPFDDATMMVVNVG